MQPTDEPEAHAAPEAQLVAAPQAAPEPAPTKSVIAPQKGERITSPGTNNTYTIGEFINEGNFSLVFECTDEWNNLLAAKVLKPLGTYESVQASAEAEVQKLFVLRHPHITHVFDAFEYRDTFYIITERCSFSVAQLLAAEWFHGVHWVQSIARSLLQAVHFLHVNGYAHQDIHPGNVLTFQARDEMDPSANATQFRLADLGVAKLLTEIDGNNTRAKWMLPPEVLNPAEYGPIDARTDIYHCGLLFLQLAYSKDLRFTTEEVLQGKPRELALQLQPPFNFALEKALRRHVPFRTASAQELWRDLNTPAQVEPAVTPVLAEPTEEHIPAPSRDEIEAALAAPPKPASPATKS